METKTRRAYSAEYKKEAVHLVNQPGQTVAGVARDLGIRAGLLGRWRREQADQGEKAFVGQGVARTKSSCSSVASWLR